MHPTNRRRVLSAWLVVATLVVVACGQAPSPVPPTAAATQADASPAGSTADAAPGSPVATPAGPTTSPITAASCVSRTLSAMTRAQRIGQLFMIRIPVGGLPAAHRAAIAGQHFGNAWYGRSTRGVVAMRALSDTIQATATAAATGGVPFLIAANQEGGLIQGLSGPGFATIPSAVAQGRLDPATLKARARTWARQLRQAGVNLNFAPVADTVPPGTAASNAPIGQLDREFGHRPKRVARHVAAFIEGMRAGGVGTTAKHVPGLGRVRGNTDHTADVVDTVTTPDDPYLRPFTRAVAHGVPFMMVALATYERIDPSSIAAFSPVIIRDLLRTRLGFDGVVMSDSLTAEAVKAFTPRQRALRFIEAGGDLIVVARLTPAIRMANALAKSAAADPAIASLVDDAARHVLRAKLDAGLLGCG